MTTITRKMLTTVATVIGSHSRAITSKYSIRATPGGTKKNAIFFIRKRHTGAISSGLTALRSSKAVSPDEIAPVCRFLIKNMAF